MDKDSDKVYSGVGECWAGWAGHGVDSIEHYDVNDMRCFVAF